MKIVIENGDHDLWYGTTEEINGLYRCLLVIGPTMDSVIDILPAAFKGLRDDAANTSGIREGKS